MPDEIIISFVIQNMGTFPCVQIRHFRILDALNFAVAEFDYTKYLQAPECLSTQGSFPYEWMDSLDKLSAPDCFGAMRSA